MIKIAITGNIASGKSTVQNIIESQGFKVLDTDVVAHELLNKLSEIKIAFKNCDIFDNNQNIVREKLGKLIFSTPELKLRLETIIHPAVKEEILEFFEQNRTDKVTFIGIPLLFESGMRDIFDEVLLVHTNDSIRKKRLIKRNNYTPEYADIRMASQLSQDEKKLLSNYIIYNNGTLSDLENSVKEFLNQLSMR